MEKTMIDAERPCAYTESQTVLTVCVYHGDRYPCRIRALTSELAEAKRTAANCEVGNKSMYEGALILAQERDSALEREAASEAFCKLAYATRDQARAEAEALRADEISWLKSLRDGFVKAVDRRMPAPDYKDVNGDTAIGEAAEKVKDVMRAITVRIKELARLSPPAPAPKVDEERLMENLKDFKTFDNRMHGKPPAPETAPAPKSDEVEIDYSDVERLANPKIRQDVDWTSGREARRSYESFYGKPAPGA